jgi:hypothetical protein
LVREAQSLPLRGLDRAEAQELFEARSGKSIDENLAARVQAPTGGNTLFIDGIARLSPTRDEHDRDHKFSIPTGLRESIRQRLAALSEKTNAILCSAAVIGDEFDAELCDALATTGEVSRALEEAMPGGVVHPLGQGRYRFSHALVRQVIYDGLETARRIDSHARLAEPLERKRRDSLDMHLTELAYHFRLAG